METEPLSEKLKELHTILDKSRQETDDLSKKKGSIGSNLILQKSKLTKLEDYQEEIMYEILTKKFEIKKLQSQLDKMIDEENILQNRMKWMIEEIHLKFNHIESSLELMSEEGNKLYEFHLLEEISKLEDIARRKWNPESIHDSLYNLQEEIKSLEEKRKILIEEIEKKDEDLLTLKYIQEVTYLIETVTNDIHNIENEIKENERIENDLTEEKRQLNIQLQQALVKTREEIERKRSRILH